jgi:hypothetical protein
MSLSALKLVMPAVAARFYKCSVRTLSRWLDAGKVQGIRRTPQSNRRYWIEERPPLWENYLEELKRQHEEAAASLAIGFHYGTLHERYAASIESCAEVYTYKLYLEDLEEIRKKQEKEERQRMPDCYRQWLDSFDPDITDEDVQTLFAETLLEAFPGGPQNPIGPKGPKCDWKRIKQEMIEVFSLLINRRNEIAPGSMGRPSTEAWKWIAKRLGSWWGDILDSGYEEAEFRAIATLMLRNLNLSPEDCIDIYIDQWGCP